MPEPRGHQHARLTSASASEALRPCYACGMQGVMLAAAAVGGVIAALLGAWNAVQISRLTGRVDEVSRQLTAHLNAPGLHGSR